MRLNDKNLAIISIVAIFMCLGGTRTRSVAAGSVFPAILQHHGHSRGTSIHSDGPVENCSDLRMEFDHEKAEVRSEEKTIPRGEAAVLKVSAGANGGVQVQGWERNDYSVTLCKAAAPGTDAESILSQISLKVSNGEVSVNGPANQDEWFAYLLVKSPKGAAIEAHATNGPLGFYRVDGKVSAKTVNGPVELEDASGDMEISARNGPVSVNRGSGNVRVRTENGPISVSLEGNSWNGTGLRADAENGPVSLHVPSGFQSSFVVESKGYSPVSCHASVCDQARKTWDDDHKRIEYGSGEAVIRLSTVNGPVTVQ
jgi:hypothetical protein